MLFKEQRSLSPYTTIPPFQKKERETHYIYNVSKVSESNCSGS